ncbi:MAG TPA: RNA polymerase sigma factor [Polyangiales bacterium]|nr:RNA polymerase sigma factor [Polyangiales bacterium]
MTDPLDELNGTLQHSLQRFLDIYEPLRPELYRYCRQLTRSPWDAEDLAQDALSRAFVTLGRMASAPPNPRAWLFRVASNLWIDRVRRTRPGGSAEPTAPGHEPRDAREAAGTLLVQLAPQERAAVVLKDVFDFSLEEVAEALSTSVNAVKAALHRGRGKLLEPEPEESRLPAAGVLDAFCAAFNACDMDALTALLLDTSSVEVVGARTEYGPTAARSGVFYGMLYGSRLLAQNDPHGVLPEPPRCELRVHRGEALLLLWYRHPDGEAVRAINRVESEGDHITRFRNYFFTPEFLAEVCAELGVPVRSNGYRYCPPQT